jgi:hypothetical protein
MFGSSEFHDGFGCSKNRPNWHVICLSLSQERSRRGGRDGSLSTGLNDGGGVMSSSTKHVVPDRGRQLREELYATLQQHVDDLAEGLVTRGSTDDLREHAARLANAFIGAMAEGLPENFISYILRLDAQRGDVENGTRTLWLALTLLEDKIWRIVAREVQHDHQVTLLSWVTQTIGVAKDRLACRLMAQMERSRSRVDRLEEVLDRLSHGTDPAPEDDEQDLAVEAVC